VCVCSNSDDHLLKNIELFDKLSLRFNGRILFIKDVIGSQEICCWSYYGHGQKIAEVCCTSIVYGTDKKHTKVRSHRLSLYWSSGNSLRLIEFRFYVPLDTKLVMSPSSSLVLWLSTEEMKSNTTEANNTLNTKTK